jgi:hypothetical protein
MSTADDTLAAINAFCDRMGAAPNSIVMSPRVYLLFTRTLMRKRQWRRLRGRFRAMCRRPRSDDQ